MEMQTSKKRRSVQAKCQNVRNFRITQEIDYQLVLIQRNSLKPSLEIGFLFTFTYITYLYLHFLISKINWSKLKNINS